MVTRNMNDSRAFSFISALHWTDKVDPKSSGSRLPFTSVNLPSVGSGHWCRQGGNGLRRAAKRARSGEGAINQRRWADVPLRMVGVPSVADQRFPHVCYTKGDMTISIFMYGSSARF